MIIKQMLLEDRKTFKDFIECDEGIATNILSDRLKKLEELKIITKEKLPENKKTNIYKLTEKGLGLTPLVVELALWSDEYIREFNPIIRKDVELIHMKNNKLAFIQLVIDNYKDMYY